MQYYSQNYSSYFNDTDTYTHTHTRIRWSDNVDDEPQFRALSVKNGDDDKSQWAQLTPLEKDTPKVGARQLVKKENAERREKGKNKGHKKWENKTRRSAMTTVLK